MTPLLIPTVLNAETPPFQAMPYVRLIPWGTPSFDDWGHSRWPVTAKLFSLSTSWSTFSTVDGPGSGQFALQAVRSAWSTPVFPVFSKNLQLLSYKDVFPPLEAVPEP